MAALRELKGRIGSVASTEKITRAMRMISSAKVHKAEQALKRLLPFRNQVCHIIGNLLSADAQFESPLLEKREVKRVAVAVFGSDDGLCGAYNSNVFKVLLEKMAEYRTVYGAEVEIVIYPIGAKVVKLANKLAGGKVAVELMDGINSKTAGDDVRVFVEKLQDAFTSGAVDKVDFLYMSYKSMSRQRPACDQLLPVLPESFVEEGKKVSCRPYIFEPDADSIFQSILPLFLLSVAHDVFAENRASELAARIMAMQAASDNAKKLLEQLQLEYNKLRQQSITTELLDILGGQVR